MKRKRKLLRKQVKFYKNSMSEENEEICEEIGDTSYSKEIAIAGWFSFMPALCAFTARLNSVPILDYGHLAWFGLVVFSFGIAVLSTYFAVYNNQYKIIEPIKKE